MFPVNPTGGWKFFCLLALSFAMLGVTSAHTAGDHNLPRTDATHGCAAAVWVWPKSSIDGVALVLHGLNLKPEKMNEIACTLTDHGVLVLRGSLTGHIDGRESLFSVTPEAWISDCLALYAEALEASKRYGVPIYFVGYSLGCLVALDLMECCERVRFERLVLFAPVLTPRPFTRTVGLLGKNRIIPSKTPAGYRMHDGLPAAAYHALLSMVRQLRLSGYRKVNRPALVFIDKKDELISFRALLELNKRCLSQWRIVTVDTGSSRLGTAYHHLIIDEDSVGTKQWRSMREKMVDFLLK